MPHVAESPADLIASLTGAAHVAGGRLVIDHEARFRSQAAADLAWTAAFTEDDPTAEAARWIVWEASQALGGVVREHPRPVSRPRPRRGPRVHRSGDQHPWTDLRHGADVLRGRRGRRRRRDLEIARSEIRTPSSGRGTMRRSCSRARSRTAGGAPCSSRATTSRSTPRSSRPTPRRDEPSSGAPPARDRRGLRNIDINPSTLVDLSKADLEEQQRNNYELCGGTHGADPERRDGGVTVGVAARSARSARRTRPSAS